MTTKIDFINSAYSRLRISGITVQPTPENVSLALSRLENMAAEWNSRNIVSGYAFEENPDTSTPHNVPREWWNAFESNLAVVLAPDFGKEASAGLQMEARGSYSTIVAQTAPIPQVQYPTRQPTGSGNSIRYNRFRRYYPRYAEAPIEPETVTMFIGDIDDFFEDYADYLNLGEDISSYTLTADSGLNVQTQSLSSPRVNYRIEAVEATSSEDSDTVQAVKIIATTSTGRKLTKIRYFELINADSTS